MLINLNDIYEAVANKSGYRLTHQYKDGHTEIWAQDAITGRKKMVYREFVAHDPALMKIMLLEHGVRCLLPDMVTLKKDTSQPVMGEKYVVFLPHTEHLGHNRPLTTAKYIGNHQYMVEGSHYGQTEIEKLSRYHAGKQP